MLEAAAHKLREVGLRIAISHLDPAELDGYDSLLNRMALLESGDISPGKLHDLKLKLSIRGPEVFGLSLFGVALGLDVGLNGILAALGQTFEELEGPRRTEREHLARLLRRLTADQLLLLHIPDWDMFPLTIREWIRGGGGQFRDCASGFMSIVV